jgi:UDP-N-acetyl-D-mannosaminuronic acid dehydrogenase
MQRDETWSRDVGVIGGCGHVGLPLSLVLADSGFRTVIYDIHREAVERVRGGVMPFQEEGAAEVLARVLAAGTLEVYDTPAPLAGCKLLVMVIGTPVDEHLNPALEAIERAVDGCLPHLRDGQVLILRSTVFPGVSERLQQRLRQRGLDVAVAFCPERVTQGRSLQEIRELPQVISAFEEPALERVRCLFGRFAAELIEMTPAEAELCKLMTNAWRYVQFAAVNQFYMIATSRGLDFGRILHGCRHHYPRMAGMPGPGLAAGPCLAKDTMQLAAFSRDAFTLGHAAMLANEGLPAHLIELARRHVDLTRSKAGILGMAFKAESDDRRDSLSYKLRRLLRHEAMAVLCTDPYVADPQLVPLERVVEECDVLFLAIPHRAYRGLRVPPEKLVIDVWSCVVARGGEPAAFSFGGAPGERCP